MDITVVLPDGTRLRERKRSPVSAGSRPSCGAVGAAIKEAKRFSGAKKCSFEFLYFEQPPQFEAGTTVDFAVKIDCTGDEASGIVDVEGVWSSDAPSGLEQIEKLALHFAG